jgi:ketosteroid isomerase-like protein
LLLISSGTSVVTDWHEALNSGDVERLVSLSHPDIEVGGPRGTGRGTQLLRQWVGRAGIRLDPRRVFHRADTVVVEQQAEWRAADTAEAIGSQTLASTFIVRDNRVVSVSRYSDLAEALSAADLDESHETRSN